MAVSFTTPPGAQAVSDLPRPMPVSRAYCVSKRVLDVVGAVAGLVLSAPLMLAVAAAIKLESRGPVLFWHYRIGEGGAPFRFYKFRSMVVDAEAKRLTLLGGNEAGGPVFKMKRDPRITRLGRILRHLSMDELPQLWHVLTGRMSLVGPRPPLPGEVANYQPWQMERLTVRPGLTCIWQVSGRSDIPFDRWVELDIMYVRNRSFWLDLKLLILTVPAVLTGRGAY